MNAETINQDAVLREGVLEEPKVGEVGRRSGGGKRDCGGRTKTCGGRTVWRRAANADGVEQMLVIDDSDRC